MLEAIVALSATLWAFLEVVKKTTLQPIRARLGFSEFQYSVAVYVVAFVAALALVLPGGRSWDVLREVGIFGYPELVGQIVAALLMTGGDLVAHQAWEILKRFGQTTEAKPTMVEVDRMIYGGADPTFTAAQNAERGV